MQPADRARPMGGDLTITIGQQPQHDPVLVTGGDDVERWGAPRHDRRRTGVVGVGLVDRSTLEQAHPRRQLRRHINHMLTGGDELLSEQRTHPCRSLDRPRTRRERRRPLQQPASLMPIGVHTDRGDDDFATVDDDRRVRPLVRVDPNDEHDALLAFVVGFATAGTPDTCHCRSSYEPHRDRTWPDRSLRSKANLTAAGHS